MPAAPPRLYPVLDVIRVAACFMVIMLHVAAINFYAFGDKWWASNIYDSVVRCSVPLFLMVSGAIFLTRDEMIGRFATRRIARLFPALLFWSIFYLAWQAYYDWHSASLLGWTKRIASGPVVFHLWYLYAIIGIYAFVPFLRLIYTYSTKAEKTVFLAIWAIVSSWPTIRGCFGISFDPVGVYHFETFVGYVGYLFFGAALFDIGPRVKPKLWLAALALFVAASMATAVATYMFSAGAGQPNELFYGYLSPFVIIAAGSAFLVLGGLGDLAATCPRVLRSIAGCTLGIYCLHMWVVELLRYRVGLSGAAGSPWWSIPVTTAAVFAISLAIIWTMRRLAVFRYVT